jgi:hypothetical protein
MEGSLALLGQLHPLDPAVVGIAAPPHKPRPLENGEVVGQGRPLDPERLGQLSLGAPAAGLEREQDQPGGQRAACERQLLLEGTRHELRGPGQLAADRLHRAPRHRFRIED